MVGELFLDFPGKHSGIHDLITVGRHCIEGKAVFLLNWDCSSENAFGWRVESRLQCIMFGSHLSLEWCAKL